MVSKNDEIWIKNEEFCITMEEFCIKNDEFCSDGLRGHMKDLTWREIHLFSVALSSSLVESSLIIA